MPALKPLMFASDERSPEYPDVPTGKEMGFPEFTHSAMNIFAPVVNLIFLLNLEAIYSY